MPGSSHQRQALQRDQRAQKRDSLREQCASGREEYTGPGSNRTVVPVSEATRRPRNSTEFCPPSNTASVRTLIASADNVSEKRRLIHDAISSKTTKKPRVLNAAAVTKRLYNLRSNSKRADAPSVTPTSIDPSVPSTSGVRRSWLTQLRTRLLEEETPKGVVGIFGHKLLQQTATCICPTRTSLEESIAFQHIMHYGIEYGSDLRTREERYKDKEICPQDPRTLSPRCSDSDPLRLQSETTMTDSPVSDGDYPFGTPEPGDVLAYQPRAIDLVSAPLDTSRDLPRQPNITARMRSILVNWLIEVALEFSVSETAFHLSVTLLDAVLSLGPTFRQYIMWRDRDDEDPPFFQARVWEFQALGCACLWLAAKLEDKTWPKVDQLVYIADESFDDETLLRLELEVCTRLGFCLHRVTPIHFVNNFLRASHACPCCSCRYDHPVLRNMVLYLLELSRVSFELSYRKPSLIAAAAVYLARVTLGLRETNVQHAADANGYWTKTLEHYTGYNVRHIRDAVLIIHKHQLVSEFATHNAAFKKYRTPSYGRVSLKTVVRVEDLGFETTTTHDELKVDSGSLQV